MRLEPAQHLGAEPGMDRLPLFRQPAGNAPSSSSARRSMSADATASAARESLRLPPQALLSRSAPDTLFRLALLNAPISPTVTVRSSP
jgi:hypothetical protein